MAKPDGSPAPPGPAAPRVARRCPACARPLAPGTTAHRRCEELPDAVSTNGWPAGSRQLRCLGCDRLFPSDSKATRLCSACRSR